MAEKKEDGKSSWAVFVDSNGEEWSKENLEDLIKAVRQFHDIMEIAEHYRYKLDPLKEED